MNTDCTIRKLIITVYILKCLYNTTDCKTHTHLTKMLLNFIKQFGNYKANCAHSPF